MASEWKQPTRTELIARHAGKSRTPRAPIPKVRGGKGFFDPTGVVAFNRFAGNTERGSIGGRCFVASAWR